MRKGHRKFALLASTSLIACVVAIAPLTIDYQLDRPVLKVAQAATCCFAAGTWVLMADGTRKPIEDLAVGDPVLGRNGRVNRVVGIERPRLGGRKLYGLNGDRPFVTAEHPFLTRAGWKAIDAAAAAAESPSLRARALEVGDLLAVAREGQAHLCIGSAAVVQQAGLAIDFVPLKQITATNPDPRTILYNLLLDGDHCYFADGYLVHNKEGGGEGGGGEGGGGSGGGGGDDGGGGGEGGDDGGEGGEGGDDGGEGGGDDDGEDGENGDDSSDDESTRTFGGLNQVGPDLSAEEEAEAIGSGWQ